MAPVLDRLTLALPKGRIVGEAVPLLRRAGIVLPDELVAESDRRLRFEVGDGLSVLLVKPTDVPTYVAYGIADVGIAGSDTLEEDPRDLYQPVDLGIGACRMVVAEDVERRARLVQGMSLRVATKYPRITQHHYRDKGIQPEIIHLHGSIELAAATGLSDQIVDLVSSGETLRQNRLIEVETIMTVTSRFIVHPASFKLKPRLVRPVIEGLRAAVEGVRA